ncbi:MAG: S-layer homology domain-containing protein [Ruminococcaceae bacterium]|nr:S-layer homology domain-containing protein [Oscillospiraceae bacterium]
MNKKVVISLFLVLTLLSGMFCMSTFAENKAEVVNSASHDFEFAKSLGIMPPDVIEDEAISRINLARCFTNVILSGAEPVVEKSAYFTDVDYSLAGYADTVYGAKIMNGVGGGLFNPDGHITYAQLAKSFVSFLGYGEKAEALGGYPGGYMAVAASLDLFFGAPQYANDYVTAEAVASAFKSALNVPVLEKVKYADTYTYVTRGRDYLEKYMHIHHIWDVVNATYWSNAINSHPVAYNEIVVGETLLTFDIKEFSVSDLFGQRVDAYYAKEEGINRMLFIENFDNEVETYTSDAIEGFSSKGILYLDGKKEKNLRLSSDVKIFYNGALCKTYEDSIFTPWHERGLDGNLTVIDNNSDGAYDFVLIEAYESFVFDALIDNIIYPKYRGTTVIDLNGYHDGLDALFVNIKGQPVSVSSLEEGVILNVFRADKGPGVPETSGVKDGITKIMVSVDSGVGNLDSYERSDAEIILTVGGIEYKSSRSLFLNPELDKLKIGARMKMMFNKDGLVSDIDFSAFEMIFNGYLTDAKQGKGLEGADKAMIRMFTDGEVFESFTLSENLELFVGDKREVIKGKDIFSYIVNRDSGRVVRQPIRYKKNKENKIETLYLMAEEAKECDGLFAFPESAYSKTSEYRSGNTRSFAGKILTNAKTSVYAVPSEAKRDDDTLYTIVNLAGSHSYTFDAYGFKKDSKVASFIIIPDSDVSKPFTEENAMFMVESVSEVINKNGDEVVRVRGYEKGNLTEHYGEKRVLSICEGGTLPKKGDIITFDVNTEEMMVNPKLIFREDTRKFPDYSANPTAAQYETRTRFIYGKIIWADDESMIIKAEDEENETVTIETYMKSASVPIYRFEKVNSRQSHVRKASVEELRAVPGSLMSEQKLLIYTRSGDMQMIAIYD